MKPTLVELTEENATPIAREMSTHIVLVDVSEYDHSQIFSRSKYHGDKWAFDKTCGGKFITPGGVRDIEWARPATKKEIAAHKPSAPSAELLVPVELLEKCRSLADMGSIRESLRFNGSVEEYQAAKERVETIHARLDALLAQREGTRS